MSYQLSQYENVITKLKYEFEEKKEHIGNQLNTLCNSINETESDMNKLNESIEENTNNTFTPSVEFTDVNNDFQNNYFIQTKQYIKQTNEMNEMRIQKELFNKRYQIIKSYLTEKEMNEIETAIGREIDTIHFDSSIHSWDKSCCQFYSCCLGYQCLLLLFETTNGKKYGYYFNNQITQQDTFLLDQNTLLFSFENNSLCKYQIKETVNTIKICQNEDEDLCIIGKNEIVLKKREKKDKCLMKQFTFNDKSKRNASLGKRDIIQVQSIVVIGSEEEMERKMKLRENIICTANLSDKQIELLEEWTSLSVDKIVFDTQYDDWSDYTCEMNDRIIGRNQLLFLCESKRGDLFGYYFNPTIIHSFTEEILADNKSFHFNLESNGRLEQPMKCEIKFLESSGCVIKRKDSLSMISIGDISLFKQEDRDKSYCWQHNEIFNYHGIDKLLCGETRAFKNGWIGKCFTLKRLIIIQMN